MSRSALRIKAAPGPGEARPPDDEPLFRPEAMAEQKAQWLGTVLLEPRVSSTLFVGAALTAALAVIAMLLLGSFTRKARISGWLVPQQGIARVFAPQAGVVTRVHVTEGTKVAKGAPLVTLSSEVRSEAVGPTRQEVVERLLARRNSLMTAADTQNRLFSQQADELSRRLNLLARERDYIDRELELQQARVRITDDAVTNQRMRGVDFSTEAQKLYELESRQQVLERNRTAHERAIMELQGKLRALPLQRRLQLAEIERGVAALDQELAEAEARRQVVVTAPQDGTVTGIQTEPGGNVNSTVPLMNVIPAGATLQAELFSPSRAIGFMRPGQRVLLRYQAFPYQKFGQYEGTIKAISRAAIGPSEMPQQLSGLTSLYGPNEPIYRVTVQLGQQTATAYGEAVALQPGMLLEADVTIESRRLIEWLLDPLYSLTGKMQK
jgi:membrane fusion protein